MASRVPPPPRRGEGGKLNVLQVCDHLGWEGSRMHGVKRLFSWMIPRFDPSRYNVSLVSLRKKDLSEETLESMGIDISYLHKSKFDPATLTALLKVMDRQQTDILHLHGYGATTFGRVAGMMRGVPTILHEHANLTDTPWFQKVADKMLAPATDIAIAVSKSTAEFVINARQMPAERVKVVYLGVPLEEFSRTRTIEEVAAARHELGAAPDEFVVGTVTRLHDSKGNSYLVEAARDVLQQRPKTRFYLFGEGPLRPELEAQARALGLGERFVFGGFTRDVARTVSAFDVSVFPSLWEGTPLTVFEALAMGKPIVATDADGLLDVLTHERDAVIVQKRDAGALARAMMRLIDTPEDRARLSVHARVTGRQYDIAAFVRKMEQLYELLHEVSRATRRRGVLTADLSFLSDGARV
jgi:glycosyltransferase involved in cell wall biosynthesis